MSEEKKIEFNLNELLFIKRTADLTQMSIAQKRMIRPFVKAVNNAIKEMNEEYEKIKEDLRDGKDLDSLSDDEKKEFFTKFSDNVVVANSKKIVEIDWTRNSSKNIVYNIWSPFQWDTKILGDASSMIDAIDEKLCSIYPDLEKATDIDNE